MIRKTAKYLIVSTSMGMTPALAEPLLLEEIVVTAQKREQLLQNVPFSVTAVNDQMIADYGIQSIQDLNTVVPSLYIYSAASPAQSSVTIRGAGTGGADPTLEPSVGIFIDGQYMPRSVFGLSDILDVERIEVLLGPQGTLYGKNTNSGVISVHTRKPSTELEGYLDVSTGNYQLLDTKLSLSGPITDTLRYRLSGRNHRRDGVMDRKPSGQDLNQIDKQAYRGQLLWDGIEKLEVLVTGYYNLADSRANSGDGFTDPASTYGLQIGGDLFPGLTSPLNVEDDDRKVYQNHLTDSRLEAKGASISMNYDVGDYLLTAVSGYQEWDQLSERDAGQSLLHTLELSNELEEQSFTQEFRLTSPSGEALEWVAGLFYFNSKLSRGSLDDDRPYATFGNAFAGTPFALLMVPDSEAFWQSDFDTQSLSAFGQVSYDLSPKWQLTTGLRYGAEEKEFAVDTRVVGGGLLGAVFGAVDQKDELSDNSLTGMLSLSYFLDDSTIYATISTGEKSGGFNAAFNSTSVEDREYDPESTINYEAGIKTNALLDGRARLNLAYFYTEYEDFQATTWNPATSSFLIGNAKRQVTQGVDLDGTVALTDELVLTTRLQYLDARYRDHDGASCHKEASAPRSPIGCDLSGRRMAFAPYWSGSVALDYTKLMGSGEFYGHADMSFKTDFYADAIFAPYAAGESYEMLNLKLGWRNDQWDISLWGRNITDETYGMTYSGNSVDLFSASSANVLNDALGTSIPAVNGNSYFRWLNDPATYGVTLRYTY